MALRSWKFRLLFCLVVVAVLVTFGAFGITNQSSPVKLTGVANAQVFDFNSFLKTLQQQQPAPAPTPPSSTTPSGFSSTQEEQREFEVEEEEHFACYLTTSTAPTTSRTVRIVNQFTPPGGQNPFTAVVSGGQIITVTNSGPVFLCVPTQKFLQ